MEVLITVAVVSVGLNIYQFFQIAHAHRHKKVLVDIILKQERLLARMLDQSKDVDALAEYHRQMIDKANAVIEQFKKPDQNEQRSTKKRNDT